MKLLTSNFSLVWKQLAYTIIRLAIIFGLVVLVSNPIVKLMIENGFADKFTHLFQTIYTDFGNFFVELRQVIFAFLNLISENISSIWFSVVLFFFVILFVNSLLTSAGEFALTFCANSSYTSLTKTGYCHSIITNFGKMSKYALVKFVLDIPFTIFKLLYIAIYCAALNNFILAIVGITIMIILYTATYALQIAMHNSVAIEMISHGTNPFKAIFKTYKTIKGFLRVFSNAIIVVLTIVFANLIIGIFTLGAGLLLTIPAAMVLVVTFELVSYYGCVGQRYYLSPTIIVDANSENTNK